MRDETISGWQHLESLLSEFVQSEFFLSFSKAPTDMSSRQEESNWAARAGGKGERSASGRGQHSLNQEPSSDASLTGGATGSGGFAQPERIVPSPSEKGIAVGLPLATVRQIDTLNNQVEELPDKPGPRKQPHEYHST